MWNQAVHTDREVTANRPDIIIKNKKEKTCTLIGVAIPADRNVVQKEAEKKLSFGGVVDLRQQPHQNRSTQFPHHTQPGSNPSTIAAGSSNDLTSTRYCKYSCECS